MFKKPIENVRQSLIKSSQKRQLKTDILKAFPRLTAEDLETLMPSKQDMYMATISGTKTVIYLSASKEPLFFDLRGGGDLIPTVYAMWILPVFLPTFVIQPETFHFIQGGADLMLPGVIEPAGGFPNFLIGEKYTITLKDTQKPIAVGKTLLNLQNARTNGMKGKCLEVDHFYSDFLWKFGSKVHPPAEVAVEGRQSLSITSAEEEEKVRKDNSKPADDIPEADDEDDKTNANFNTEQIDATLLSACLYGLKKVPKDALPLQINMFLSKYMIPYRPLGTTLDLKHSSYKKLLPFLRYITDMGLIEMQEDSPGVFTIVNIYKDNERIKSFVLHEIEPIPEVPVDPNVIIPIEPIEELWGLNQNMRFICPPDIEPKRFYTLNFLNDMLWKYVKDHKLVPEKMPKNIMLDEALCAGLYTKKDQKVAGDIVEKKDVGLKFKSKLVTAHKISIDGVYEQRKGLPPPVEITVEKKMNKNVTIVHGLLNFGIDLNFFAAYCSKKFASTCNVQKIDISHEKSILEVWVQGKKHDDVAAILTEQYKLPNKYVKVTPPSGSKSKRGK